jgi:hypothetical protein
MYILIIIGWIGGYAPGTITTMQEFSSEQSCNEARALLLDEAKKFKVESTMRAICVKK